MSELADLRSELMLALGIAKGEQTMAEMDGVALLRCEHLARQAAEGGLKPDRLVLAGVLMLAAHHESDEAIGHRYLGEALATLDRMADEGDEDALALIVAHSETATPEAIAEAKRLRLEHG